MIDTEGVNVLVVDDSIINLQVIGEILTEEGYTTVMAKNATETMDALKTFEPDLILLDVMMPEVDGFELCRRIKKFPKFEEVPVVFITAKSEIEDLIEGFSAGGVDYITKPFYRDELLARLNTHIELAFSKQRIKKMLGTRDKLYSIISHDLRSPFSSILLTINSLDNRLLEPGSEAYYNIINMLKKTANDTYSLLENLLSWTRSQSESILVEKDAISLKTIVNDCVMMQIANAQNKNITLEAEIDEDIAITADYNMIQTALRNLISNAVKFTPKEGSITVSVSKTDKEALVAVSDTGVGISEENQKKLFNDETHFTTYGTNREKGSGLGLMLVKDFIEKNDGTIEVSSKLNKGSVFTIRLPLAN